MRAAAVSVDSSVPKCLENKSSFDCGGVFSMWHVQRGSKIALLVPELLRQRTQSKHQVELRLRLHHPTTMTT